jgi:hypothetical protein
VDNEVYGATVELEEAKMRSIDGWSGPSMWRCLAGEEEGVRLILGQFLVVAQLDAELHSASGKRCAQTRLTSV